MVLLREVAQTTNAILIPRRNDKIIHWSCKLDNRRILLIVIAVLALASVAGVTVGIHLENRDAFCASCHTEPESTYFERAQQPPSDLASAHAFLDTATVRCIDCHSGQGDFGRVYSLSQGTWDLIHYLSGRYSQPATSTNPIGDVGCEKCHTPRSMSNALFTDTTIPSRSHYHFTEFLDEWASRAPHPAGTCAYCHVAHSQGGTEVTRYTPVADMENACNNCHTALAGWEPPSQ